MTLSSIAPGYMPRGETAARRGQLARPHRALVFGGVALALLVGCCALWMRSKGLLPWSSDAVKIAKFASTREFAALPVDKQRPYVKAMLDHRWELALAYKTGTLSRAEVSAAAANCWKAATAQYVEEYAALRSPAEKQNFLDRTIDELDRCSLLKWASGAGLRGDPRETKTISPKARWRGTEGSNPWTMPGRIKKLIETLPPVQRAQVSALYAALMKRRTERATAGVVF